MEINHMKHIIVLASALLLSACSSQLLLTIESEPAGAAVYEGGKFWGHAPVTLSYTGNAEYVEGGCIGTRPIMVEWDSGAQARVSTINMCGGKPSDQEYLFTYPAGFPQDVNELADVDGLGQPLKRVAPNGQLYWEVLHEDSDASIRCYSDLSGATVKPNCS